MNNGIRHAYETKIEAQKLRTQGFTHREIRKKLYISLATAHLWTKDIILTELQKENIKDRCDKKYREFIKNNPTFFSENAKKNLKPFQYSKIYTKAGLIKEIKDFYKNNGRIPLKREFDRRVFRQYFGTWNNAIKIAGFEPNPVLFSKKFIAKDGHSCDSFAEKIIDDWLAKHGIEHERSKNYPNSKMTADFAMGDVMIEYFGLAGQLKKYDKYISRKKEICAKEGINLIEIYPADLSNKDYMISLVKKITDLR